MQLSGKMEIRETIAGVIKENVSPDVFKWLEEKAQSIREEQSAANLNIGFVAVPRKTGRKLIIISAEANEKLEAIHPKFSVEDWTIDRLCRVWLLMQVSSLEKDSYINKIETLFRAAEMNELVALYSSLYFFDFPEEWNHRCAEGIRSNIGNVLEAIMYNNPYPYKYLAEPAWNQLVLKAFFTDKIVDRIIGLDERANKELASILIDYASERTAAGRSVNPQLWRLVSKFIDESNFNYIQKLFKSDDVTEKNAAALVCLESDYEPARQLLEQDNTLKTKILDNKLSWSNV
jgi:hypothetical protein